MAGVHVHSSFVLRGDSSAIEKDGDPINACLRRRASTLSLRWSFRASFAFSLFFVFLVSVLRGFLRCFLAQIDTLKGQSSCIDDLSQRGQPSGKPSIGNHCLTGRKEPVRGRTRKRRRLTRHGRRNPAHPLFFEDQLRLWESGSPA